MNKGRKKRVSQRNSGQRGETSRKMCRGSLVSVRKERQGSKQRDPSVKGENVAHLPVAQLRFYLHFNSFLEIFSFSSLFLVIPLSTYFLFSSVSHSLSFSFSLFISLSMFIFYLTSVPLHLSVPFFYLSYSSPPPYLMLLCYLYSRFSLLLVLFVVRS